MSIQPETNSPDPDGLQFDHAEFENPTEAEAPVLACASCHQPINDQYFEINGTTLCEPCRVQVEGQLRGGSGVARLLRAVILGSLASLLGTIIYVAFLSVSPIDISIVAILIGFMVGKMVRKGSGNRGGLVYQILAVFLTYTSLAMTYFTLSMIDEFGAKPAPAAAAPANPPGAVQPAPAEEAQNPPQVDKAMIAQIVFALFCFAYTTPILMAQQSPIMIAFVGFAVWEAWKMNKKLAIVVTGPYRLGDSGPIEGLAGHA